MVQSSTSDKWTSKVATSVIWYAEGLRRLEENRLRWCCRTFGTVVNVTTVFVGSIIDEKHLVLLERVARHLCACIISDDEYSCWIASDSRKIAWNDESWGNVSTGHSNKFLKKRDYLSKSRLDDDSDHLLLIPDRVSVAVLNRGQSESSVKKKYSGLSSNWRAQSCNYIYAVVTVTTSERGIEECLVRSAFRTVQ